MYFFASCENPTLTLTQAAVALGAAATSETRLMPSPPRQMAPTAVTAAAPAGPAAAAAVAAAVAARVRLGPPAPAPAAPPLASGQTYGSLQDVQEDDDEEEDFF